MARIPVVRSVDGGDDDDTAAVAAASTALVAGTGGLVALGMVAPPEVRLAAYTGVFALYVPGLHMIYKRVTQCRPLAGRALAVMGLCISASLAIANTALPRAGAYTMAGRTWFAVYGTAATAALCMAVEMGASLTVYVFGR